MSHLITDNNDLNRLVIKILLEKNNIIVDDTDNGKKALDLVKKDLNKYNIIWMNVNLPKMDGIDCTKKLRNELFFSGEIIGITSHVDPDMIEECKKAGMNVVIPKPVTEDILKEYIKKTSQRTINLLKK